MASLKKTGTDLDGKWVVLIHGYGADAQDLRPLADIMHLPKEINWLFPNGTLEVPIGPNFTGRAWFPIDMMALQEAMMRGEHRKFSDKVPPGLAEARSAVQSEIEKLGVPWSQIVLGGFSQGAMLAMDIALHLEESPLGLVLLSGALVCENEWLPLMDRHRGVKVFQSHGRMDPVLSFNEAEALHRRLVEKEISTEFHPFDGGHEIPPMVLQKARSFLIDLLK